MEFVKSKPRDQPKSNVLMDWVHTLIGFKILRMKTGVYRFKYFEGRLINQDTLKYLFGQIEQRGARNVKPNCSAFEDYCKIMLVESITDRD